MKTNPYNNSTPAKKQLANVEIKAGTIKSKYAIICFDNDEEEVLHLKARRRAIADFGSQIQNVDLEYKINSRENLL
jgi:hypothetical protein